MAAIIFHSISTLLHNLSPDLYTIQIWMISVSHSKVGIFYRRNLDDSEPACKSSKRRYFIQSKSFICRLKVDAYSFIWMVMKLSSKTGVF